MANRQPRGRELQLLRSFGAGDGREEALRRKIAEDVEVDRRSHLEMSPWLDCDRLECFGPDLDPELVAAAASARLCGPPHPDYGALSDGGVSLLEDLSSGGEQLELPPAEHHSELARSSRRVLAVLAVLCALLLTVVLFEAKTAPAFKEQSIRST